MCMCVFICTWVQVTAKDRGGSIGSCATPDVGGLNSGPLEEQHMLLAAEPSLKPPEHLLFVSNYCLKDHKEWPKIHIPALGFLHLHGGGGVLVVHSWSSAWVITRLKGKTWLVCFLIWHSNLSPRFPDYWPEFSSLKLLDQNSQLFQATCYSIWPSV